MQVPWKQVRGEGSLDPVEEEHSLGGRGHRALVPVLGHGLLALRRSRPAHGVPLAWAFSDAGFASSTLHCGFVGPGSWTGRACELNGNGGNADHLLLQLNLSLVSKDHERGWKGVRTWMDDIDMLLLLVCTISSLSNIGICG